MFKFLRRFFKSAKEAVLPPTDKHGNPKPADDKAAGLMWVLSTDREWMEVCDFCHGNCGQCGITGRVGNVPASLQAIVDNGNWASGNHAGLPRG